LIILLIGYLFMKNNSWMPYGVLENDDQEKIKKTDAK
jgi:hypothetical protein